MSAALVARAPADDEPARCVCGHLHYTTLGPCTGWTTCGCRTYRPDHDDPASVARRRRDLLEAVDSCPHNLSKPPPPAHERTG